VAHSTDDDTVTTQLLKMVEKAVLEEAIREGIATDTAV